MKMSFLSSLFARDVWDKLSGRDKTGLKKKTSRGFTLVELIVVVAIIGVMTTVITLNFSRANSRTVLSNTAHEISLAIREAQISAVSTLGVADGGDDRFKKSFGVVFSPETSEVSVYSFDRELSSGDFAPADVTVSGPFRYTGAELISTMMLPAGNYIKTVVSSASSGGASGVFFTRPSTEADIRKMAGEDNLETNFGVAYQEREVVITLSTSNDQFTREITVNAAGNILVE